MEYEKLGVWAFYVGLILAVILAVIFSSGAPVWAVIVLGIIGIIVGLLNVTSAETATFLVASIAFLVSFWSLSALVGSLALGWLGVQTFFTLLQVFVAPAAAIVAIKTIYEVTKSQ